MMVFTYPAVYDRNDDPYKAYAYKSSNNEITLRLSEVTDDLHITMRPDQLIRLIELLNKVFEAEVEEGQSDTDTFEVYLN